MRHFTIRSLLAAATMLTASIAHAETLTLSTPDPDTSEITLAAKKFAEIVSTKTNGELTIKVFPNGTLYGGDPAAGVKQLAGGSLDMLLNSTSLYATFNPKFTAIAIPYQFRDIDQLRAYLDSENGQELEADLSKIGIKGVDLWSRPLRQITNSKLPITSPADLKGLKLRVPNNPLWVEFFGAMGAAPTPMAFAEVYNALQLKVVDGQENPINVPVSAKLYEVQTYATISNHIADAWVLGMNPARYEGLSDAFKTALSEAAKETETWKASNDAADIEKSIATLKANGMEVSELTETQRKAFVDVAAGLEEKFAALVKDKAFFDRTRAFVTTN
ncbi:tripartite ATP-independent transporter DctP family solute receptor [Rhizobium sp. PP-WC-2G-219]|uniref:DctP family TRAP transporter solute-binding subunit n=1 Tax=Rhizobium sp. 9140 TaxID=1761900 RepID=UPI00079B7BF3|nr:DctP family TRAP transporter solute-binding subunit [Rhizobium sp. 9140]PYE23070.1 tripartite ATP-independent transporter DctP family solute receptor [Rhizobium sp. PP-CC-3A-592]PYE40658.1 tripartite ATP-independent transporter DctP family solute receptor [Rhizobium sp. PP-F2F-G20b]TCL90086.1 tripartite ATP-independent transporter DctP family solute receptor [Rhizobium sp. PP-WC-2G-219]CZT37406.1 tripartite ATP-independent transporter solute receptor, DctP family [Rhizobium sp. 9140]